MNNFKNLLVTFSIAAGLSSALRADTIFDFQLTPEDQAANTAVALYAPPGNTLGWGYTLRNLDTTDYLMILDVQPTINFQYGTPDSSIFDFPVLAPGGSITRTWQQDAAGLYQFTWDANAPQFAQSGQFVISATWYTQDPNTCNYQCTEQFQTQTQELVPFAVTTTPEPSALLTACSGVLAVGLFLLRKRPS
jgi:hypothetical protein